jgi:hypothetical protein
MRTFHSALIVVSFFASVHLACAQDIFYYTSGSASWVGHGATRTMTPAEGATFSGFRYFSQGAYTNAVSISVSDSVDSWDMQFVGPNETLPVVGDYPDATRWPFNGNGAGLSWVGNGRGDNTLTGNFQVLDAEFDSSGNLVSFAANFTQYDEGSTAAWNIGEIRYNSSVPIPEPSSLILLGGIGLLGLRQGRRGQMGSGGNYSGHLQ